MRTLSRTDARRLAVRSQLLAGSRPGSLLEVIERLGRVQVDPTSIVARAERLTLWSRLGAYDVAELRRLLEVSRDAFEHGAHLLPVTDLALHRAGMRRFPNPRYTRGRYIAEWMRDNAGFRAYVLGELRARGALRSSQLDDRAEVPWQTGGWNDGKNLGRMLEFLWAAGEIAISRREGNERVWDLAGHVLPEAEELPDEIVAIELLDRSLRARGLTQVPFGTALDGDLPARQLAVDSLLADGVAVPVAISGISGEWVAHRDALAELDAGAWAGRTAILGPFDPLIADRERTQALFGFTYAFELYVPAAKRRYGPYALVVLHGDALIGRLDVRMDRSARRLIVNAAYPEPAAPSRAWPAVQRELNALGTWLGATAVDAMAGRRGGAPVRGLPQPR